MFTGLVQFLGEIRSSAPRGEGRRITIAAGPLAERARAGDSIAVDGCCLTVVEVRDGDAFSFDVLDESLRRTTLGERGPGAAVNLEAALRAGEPMGGHIVQGHVDTVTTVTGRRERGDDVDMDFALPPSLRGHVVEKGSIAVDGVSMTVTRVDEETFSLALIPHTLAATTLGLRRSGDRVNLEGDVLAKYVAALVGRVGSMR